MPFSVLLLTAASSKRSIVGVRDSKVVMSGQLQPGEVVLFFQLDKARSGLDLEGDGVKCCDGLIFRSQDDETKKTICLVELKSNTFGDPADQIIETRRRLQQLLERNCKLCSEYLNNIKWTACIYAYTSSPVPVAECKSKLRNAGFGDIILMQQGRNDIGPFLRGENETPRGRNRR